MRIEDECGLRIGISSSNTYILTLNGLIKDEEDCTCEITLDTTTISKGEYKGK